MKHIVNTKSPFFMAGVNRDFAVMERDLKLPVSPLFQKRLLIRDSNTAKDPQYSLYQTKRKI